jgi:hypothetical protein
LDKCLCRKKVGLSPLSLKRSKSKRRLSIDGTSRTGDPPHS